MNKTKMILAGTGGAIGLIALVLAFLVWQAFSAKTAAIEGDDEEGIDGLETVEARAQALSRKPVYPCGASLTAIGANQKALEDWCTESRALAARGDRVFPKTTPAQFKTDLVADAKRLMSLPGAVQGKLVKPEFAFGPFKDYIAEGKMPSEAELAELQRKWDDVSTITEMLSTNGVAELVDVSFAAVNGGQGTGDREQEKGKKARGSQKKNPSAGNSPLLAPPSSFSYVFTFTARPPAFVRTLNDLEACERFVTVDAFTFARPSDVIADAFGGDERNASKAQSSGGRRGRRGRRGEAASSPLQDDKKSETKNGLVTDPLADAPMTVTMTVTVHDFRSLEEGKNSGEEGK